MNRSHLLPATLLALAAVAIAQSTQNQSNIARLVNVINQVTAKVDGVIPLRDHQTHFIEGEEWFYTVPLGNSAEVTHLGGIHYTTHLEKMSPSGEWKIFLRASQFGGGNASSNQGNRVVLHEGDHVRIVPGNYHAWITLALEEI